MYNVRVHKEKIVVRRSCHTQFFLYRFTLQISKFNNLRKGSIKSNKINQHRYRCYLKLDSSPRSNLELTYVCQSLFNLHLR